MEPVDPARRVSEEDAEGIPETDELEPEQRMSGEDLQEMVAPRDRLRAADRHGTTAAEQREGTPHAVRMREEGGDRPDEPSVQISGPSPDGVDDDEEQAIAEERDRDGAPSAEESAMHVDRRV